MKRVMSLDDFNSMFGKPEDYLNKIKKIKKYIYLTVAVVPKSIATL